MVLSSTAQDAAKKSKLVYVDSVLAVVNNRVMTIYDVISESKFQEEIEVSTYSKADLQNPDILEKISSKTEKIREEVADKLLEEYLIDAEFKRNGFTLPQAAVDDRVHRVAARVAKGDMEVFRKQLKESGITMSEFRQRTRRKVAVEALLQQEVYDRIIVPPSKIEAYYKANLETFTTKKKIRLQLLMISEKDAESLTKKKAEVEKALKNGTAFDDATKTYSIGPNKDTGGDLGWTLYSQQKKDVLDAIHGLEKGSISKGIVDGLTCYWLKVLDREEGKTLPLSQVKENIREIISKDQREKYYQDYIRRLMTRSYVRKYY